MPVVPPGSGAWCGVDLGTSNVKILLLADDGRVLARSVRPTPRTLDALGPCTDGEALFALVEDLVIEAARSAALRVPLRAICTAGTGEDGLLLDAADRPLALAIPWHDRRGEVCAAELAAASAWREARWSGGRPPVPLDATRTAAKWAWLARHRPDLLERASCWVALTDYPAVRWSGRRFLSETLAARTACFDVLGRAWIEPLLAACAAPRLPPVLAGGTVLGPVRHGRLAAAGLAGPHTMVVVGGHDHPMGGWLVARQQPGAVLDSLGTAELVYLQSHAGADLPGTAPPQTAPPQTLPPESPASGAALFALSRPVDGQGIAWLGVMELSRALDPLLRGPVAQQPELRGFLERGALPGQPGAGGLRYLPWLEPAQLAPAAPPGLRLRAVLEGCAFQTRRMLGEVALPGGAQRPVFVAGGWSRIDGLMQLRANILGVPLLRIEEPELTALGAARLAMQACGAAPGASVLATRCFQPDADQAAAYDVLCASPPAGPPVPAAARPVAGDPCACRPFHSTHPGSEP